jgi:hypothetical protein
VGTFSTNILLSEPTPFDPAVANAWGTILNTNFSLIDSAVAGYLPLSVAGAVNVALTVVSGGADQSRNAHFVFTGVLTGNINVLWPQGLTRVFSVLNSTTGAFTLSLGANNGSLMPAGTTQTIPQGAVGEYVSDGTNVTLRVNSSAIGLPTGTSGHVVPYLDGVNTWSGNQLIQKAGATALVAQTTLNTSFGEIST